MSAKHKIVHGCGPSNINLGTFVSSFVVPVASVRVLRFCSKMALHKRMKQEMTFHNASCSGISTPSLVVGYLNYQLYFCT